MYRGLQPLDLGGAIWITKAKYIQYVVHNTFLPFLASCLDHNLWRKANMQKIQEEIHKNKELPNYCN